MPLTSLDRVRSLSREGWRHNKFLASDNKCLVPGGRLFDTENSSREKPFLLL